MLFVTEIRSAPKLALAAFDGSMGLNQPIVETDLNHDDLRSDRIRFTVPSFHCLRRPRHFGADRQAAHAELRKFVRQGTERGP